MLCEHEEFVTAYSSCQGDDQSQKTIEDRFNGSKRFVKLCIKFKLREIITCTYIIDYAKTNELNMFSTSCWGVNKFEPPLSKF